MSTDVVTIDAAADVHEAYRILGSHSVRRLPVMDGEVIVGMLTVDDLEDPRVRRLRRTASWFSERSGPAPLALPARSRH